MYIYMGGTGLKFESWKAENNTQNASTPFLLLSERKVNREMRLASHPRIYNENNAESL